MIDISVIIPHYDQIDDLEKCLQSIEAQIISGQKFEILVADNGTPGGLGPLIAAFPSVKFLHIAERGAACARNGAMAVAQGKYFAFIDSDCVAASGWLAAGVAALEENNADLIGGRIEVTYLDGQNPTPVEVFEKVFGFRQEMYVTQKGFSVTANLFIRARDAKVNGTFTNGIAEDVDWCHRARALGLHLSFHGKALVRHPARHDWGALKLKWQRLISERWTGYKKGLDKQLVIIWGKWICLSCATALSAFAHIPMIVLHRDLAWGDRIGALKILFRIRFWRAKKMLEVVSVDIANAL